MANEGGCDQLSYSYTFRASTPAPLSIRLALLCCPEEIECRLFRVLPVVKRRVSSLTR